MADDKKPEAQPEDGAEYKVKEIKSADKPIVAPDGHVVLSQEDIDARS